MNYDQDPTLQSRELIAAHGHASCIYDFVETMLDDVCVIHGTHTPNQPIGIDLGDGSEIIYPAMPDDEEARATAVGEIERLKAAGYPAKFGKGGETVLDESVRAAVQVRADGGEGARPGADPAAPAADPAAPAADPAAPAAGASPTAPASPLTIHHFDPAESGILADISKRLLQDESLGIEATLYAVNVYSEGGHFDWHKDTPRDDGFFGTLVVVLPTHFEGGKLSFHESSGRFTSTRKPAPHRVAWSAFFGSVLHSVRKVTSGHRVSISYVLRYNGAGSVNPQPPAMSAQVSELSSRFRAMQRDNWVCPNVPAMMAWTCSHSYSPGSFGPSFTASAALESWQLAHLKGRDLAIAQAAVQAGFDVYMQPLVFMNATDVPVDYDHPFNCTPAAEDEAKTKTLRHLLASRHSRVFVAPTFLDASRAYGDYVDSYDLGSETLVCDKAPEFSYSTFINGWNPRLRRYYRSDDNGDGIPYQLQSRMGRRDEPIKYGGAAAVHLGNEDYMGFMYSAAALAIYMPAWPERDEALNLTRRRQLCLGIGLGDPSSSSLGRLRVHSTYDKQVLREVFSLL